MTHDVGKITEAILAIEDAINARWNSGDYMGFVEAYPEDVTYFDPLTARCLIGRQAVKEHFGKYFTGAINLQNYLAGKDGELIREWFVDVFRQFDCRENLVSPRHRDLLRRRLPDASDPS